MSILKNSPAVSRRRFLRGALTAGAGTVAVAAMPAGVAETSGPKPDKKTHKGYRVTPHIAQYYKTAAL